MNSVFTECSDSSAAEYRGWLFYDAQCDFCTRWARALEPLLLSRGFHVAALQDVWVAPLFELSRAELLQAVRVWTPSGPQFAGADAVLHVAQFLPWARPLIWLSRIPGMKSLLRAGYARIAERRHCIHACAPHPAQP
jgi:predicted DCC family thiol-disulfide oxidoreductase YuxK